MSQESWDRHFIRMSLLMAEKSKDPSTKVGSIIVGRDNELIAGGYNGFPRGIKDTEERLNDRPTKLDLVVHAEMNAILSAARNGTKLRGSTMYMAATDSSGSVWGGAPCIRCTVELIQAGITEVVSLPFKTVPSRWLDSINRSKLILEEAGILLREVEWFTSP